MDKSPKIPTKREWLLKAKQTTILGMKGQDPKSEEYHDSCDWLQEIEAKLAALGNAEAPKTAEATKGSGNSAPKDTGADKPVVPKEEFEFISKREVHDKGYVLVREK